MDPIDADYEARARAELEAWTSEVLKGPSLMGRAARGAQVRVNRMIPEKVHAAVTVVMEKMIRMILTGSDLTTADPRLSGTLREREAEVERRIAAYRATAAAEGGIAGAGGFALGMAEFPVLITTKLKLLFDIAALYGQDTAELSERLYVLHIFQLAFSSAEHRQDVFADMADWDARAPRRPRRLRVAQVPAGVPRLHRPGEAGAARPDHRRTRGRRGELPPDRPARRGGDQRLPDALAG
jgi:hypothetical protein